MKADYFPKHIALAITILLIILDASAVCKRCGHDDCHGNCNPQATQEGRSEQAGEWVRDARFGSDGSSDIIPDDEENKSFLYKPGLGSSAATKTAFVGSGHALSPPAPKEPQDKLQYQLTKEPTLLSALTNQLGNPTKSTQQITEAETSPFCHLAKSFLDGIHHTNNEQIVDFFLANGYQSNGAILIQDIRKKLSSTNHICIYVESEIAIISHYTSGRSTMIPMVKVELFNQAKDNLSRHEWVAPQNKLGGRFGVQSLENAKCHSFQTATTAP